jgi:signal transduction histidine kinase
MGDMTKIVLLTALTCLVTALLGAIALQVLRGRSLLWSIVVAALVPLLAVTASVILNVQLMFISAHDSTAVSIALGCATVIGVLLSFVLGRRVATSSRQLTSALRDLAGPRGPASQRATSTPPRSAAPAEITALAEELDVTRDRLESAERQARAVEDSRRELVAFMSHDLRTPLAGLRALAEGLEDGVVDDQPGALRQMRQTVERMNGLVNDLFELSRLQAGTSGAGQQPGAMVSVLELSHDIVGELSAHAKQRGVALVLEAPPDDDRLAVHGNGEELARALTNLVGNAIRHTGRDGSVSLSSGRGDDGRIRVAVTDGCGGIAEPDLDRLFDVGWRAAPDRSSEDAGAGLGLAIAKGIVEAHSGSVGVSNVRGGCRFEVHLPGSRRLPA